MRRFYFKVDRNSKLELVHSALEWWRRAVFNTEGTEFTQRARIRATLCALCVETGLTIHSSAK
jgi:hypothetical protein